jgi:hypothetical protein
MWLRLFAWMLLLGASAFFAKETFGLDPSQFSALPVPQRLAAGVMALAALSLIGSAIWQAYRLARQDKDLKLLRARFKGIRRDTVMGHVSQDNFDTAVQNLFDSNPEEAISSLQKKLADTEQRATSQQGQYEAVDNAGSGGRHPAPPTSPSRDDRRSCRKTAGHRTCIW